LKSNAFQIGTFGTQVTERPPRFRAAAANHSLISWGHINLLEEYDFSDQKLRDSVGIPPPKIVVKSQARMRERKPT
jgi:hypothetical protein